MSLEAIVRPFAEHFVFPHPFTKPGGSGTQQMVRVAIGFQGQIKSMGYSYTANVSTKMGQIHQEEVAQRAAAKAALKKAADD